ncbi:phage portal protein [Dyadobacter sp. 3J3]|uniref:phage portal protein n=1 Tax=Dyadobacter sp. 3J3 TaxID=2606600 RepID=UPI0013586A6A|nr:phage portal protein [Dyadobacter sp. 3J3]
MNYETLKQWLNQVSDTTKLINILCSQGKDFKIEDLKKQWDVKEHAVMNESIRPKRTVNYEYDESDGNGGFVTKTGTKQEYVNRIPVPMQKNIVGKAVTFLFGNPVDIQSDAASPEEILVLDAIKKILDDNKTDSQNRVIAKNLFKSTQVVEIWYPELKEEEHEDYGFKTKFRLRLSIFSPWDGSELYPYFDEKGDLIAFSRLFVIKDDENKNVKHFECYTSDNYYLWQNNQQGWTLSKKTPNILKRIPLVFAEQEDAEWADVQFAIERLEILLSSHGDTNDYNGSPTVVAEGQILSLGKKGEQGKVIEVEKGGKVGLMVWEGAPESIRMEVENMFKVILTYTQTPDISFEAVKGMGAISGIALRLLFMDAHLKVMDKRETFDPYLKRRLNIIKSFVGSMNVAWAKTASKLKVDAEIIPYTIKDVMEEINALVVANGGKPIISQMQSVNKAGLVSDPVADFKQIQEETTTANTFSISGPTI